MQSVYSTVPADWATGHSLRMPYHSSEMQSVYSTVPADWATGHSLRMPYPSSEMQSVYSTTLADWATKGRFLFYGILTFVGYLIRKPSL